MSAALSHSSVDSRPAGGGRHAGALIPDSPEAPRGDSPFVFRRRNLLPRAAILASLLLTAASPVTSAIREVLPGSGETVRHFPVIVGVHFDEDFADLRLETILNGVDITQHLLPWGLRRPTELRPVERASEAYAEIGFGEGIIPGPNVLTFRILDASRLELDSRTVQFDFEPGPTRVDYTILEKDAAGHTRPVPARLHVLALGGTTQPNFSPAAGDLFEPRDPKRDFINSTSGQGTLFLPAGQFRLLASRGLRYGIATALVSKPGDNVSLILDKLIETPGEVAADLHVHSVLSGDSAVPLRMRLASFMATDVDAFVATDHNMVADFDGALASLPGARERLAVIPGTEYGINGSGHWNVWPLAPVEQETLREARTYFPREARPARLFDLVGTLMPRPAPPSAPPSPAREGLISLNHPLGIIQVPTGTAVDIYGPNPVLNAAIGYLSNIGYDPTSRIPPDFDPDRRLPNDTLRRTSHVPVGSNAPRDNLGFDLLEVWNRNSYSLYVTMRGIWFQWLNEGIRKVAVGNSDTHELDLIRPGIPRNMVRIGRTAVTGGTLDIEMFNRALAAGRSYATTGPLLEVRARPAVTLRSPSPGTAGLGETLRVPGGAFLLDVTVRAAPWVPVDELRIYANGALLTSLPVPSVPAAPEEDRTLRLRTAFSIRLPRGGWVVVEAGVDDAINPAATPRVGGDYALLSPGTWPLAFTNPIYIEAANASTRLPSRSTATAREEPPGETPDGATPPRR